MPHNSSKFSRKTSLFLIVLVLLIGCTEAPEEKVDSSQTRLKICCTTSIVKDAVEKIVGDKAQVYSLMGPGIDPHSYKASQGDLIKLKTADIIFYNGLHLEGKMVEVLENLSKRKAVFPLSDSLDKSRVIMYNDSSSPDPHIWFDPMLWSQCLGAVYGGLSAVDPENKALYSKNLERYRKEMVLLDLWAKEELEKIPFNFRYLITSHDAFRYFSRAYNIEVKALQGVSTSAEFGLRDVVNLVDFVTEKKIPAMFTESSIPQKFIESVQEACIKKGHRVKIGGELFSDALGEPDTYLGTYLGVFHYNVETIVKALEK